jgi:hypothetical protein
MPAEQARLDRQLAEARRASTDAAGTAAWLEGWATPVNDVVADLLGHGRTPIET